MTLKQNFVSNYASHYYNVNLKDLRFVNEFMKIMNQTTYVENIMLLVFPCFNVLTLWAIVLKKSYSEICISLQFTTCSL